MFVYESPWKNQEAREVQTSWDAGMSWPYLKLCETQNQLASTHKAVCSSTLPSSFSAAGPYPVVSPLTN